MPEATPWGTGTAGTYYFFDGEIAAHGRAYAVGVLGDATPGANPLEVIPAPGGGMNVRIRAGAFRQASIETSTSIFFGTDVALTAADPTYPRIDYVSMWLDPDDTTVHVTVTIGRPDNSSPLPTVPIPRERNADTPNVVLAMVMIHPGMTDVVEEHIYDRRFFLPFQFTGIGNKLATAVLAVAATPAGNLVTWNSDRNVENSGRALTTVGDLSGPAAAVDGEVALYDGVTGKLLKRGTGTGPARLTSGVLGIGATNLASEVTGDLPLANVAPAAGGSTLLGRGDAGPGDWQAVTLGANLTMTGTTLAAAGGAGGGDFVGPAASVDSEVVLFSGTTGKLGKRSTGTGVTRIAAGVQSAAELSGDVTTSGSNATTIASNAVTLGKMQDIAQDRVLGRVAAGSGDIQELTAAQMLTLLGLSGGTSIRTVRLGSDVGVVASTAAVPVSGLDFTALGTGTFIVLYALRYQSTTAATGIRYGLGYTGTASILYNSMLVGASGAHDQDLLTAGALSGIAGRAFASDPLPVASVSVDTVNSDMLLWLFALIEMTVTGDLQLYTGGDVATGTTTTKAGSGAILFKLI